MPCYLYILYSKSLDKYYIGSTGDISDRLERHNTGRSIYTKSGIPWELKYFEEYETRSNAYKREQEIKSWKDRQMIEDLVRTSRS
jgi:putative endonuclease